MRRFSKPLIAVSLFAFLGLCIGLGIKAATKSKSLPAKLVPATILAKGLNKVDPPVSVEIVGNTLKVSNTSDKNIVYVSFLVDFISPGKDDSYATIKEIGNRGFLGELPAESAPSLTVGQTKELTIIEEREQKLVARIRKEKNFVAETVDVKLDMVLFSDDTMWRLGYMHKRDTTNTKNWKPIRASNNQTADHAIAPTTLWRDGVIRR